MRREQEGFQHRNEILEILARRRVSDLTTTARALVMDTIQVLRLTTHADTSDVAEEWVANMLLQIYARLMPADDSDSGSSAEGGGGYSSE